jgi:8-oxo-dGTP pyrophosphatase MutT (NUDIX family)
MKTRRHTSSGGVIFKAKEDGVQVVLISHHNQKGKLIWCLPKGSVEKGESLQETAIREVREETGVVGRILEKIGQIQYWFYSKEEETKIFKTVHFFLLEYLQGNETDHDGEVDEARWVVLSEAHGMLTHESERQIMDKAATYLTAMFGRKEETPHQDVSP